MPNWQQLIAKFRNHGVEFDTGLSQREMASVEERFQFMLPADLRAFLQTALPRGEHFPDWRAGDKTQLADWLDRPREEVLFDVEQNNFWLDERGTRPDTLADAKAIVSQLIDDAGR